MSLARIREWLSRTWGTLASRPRDADLEEELRLHLELTEEHARRTVDSPDEAMRAARLRVGGLSQAMDALRDQRGFPWLEDMLRDVTHALRTLRQTPVFTATVVVILALGIGATSAVFSVVNAILLRPLPYADSRRLVYVWSTDRNHGTQSFSYPDFLDLRAQTRTLEHLVSWGGLEPILTGTTEPERLQAVVYEGDLLGLLGATPMIGTARVDRNGPHVQTVVVSYALWQRRFGADTTLVGKPIALNGQPYVVSAVMPRSFRFPIQGEPVDAWIPLMRFNPALERRRDARLIEVVARLQSTVTLQQAQAEVGVIAANLRRQFPATNAGVGMRLTSMLERATGDVSRPLWILLGAVGCVLAIACVNIANLLSARALGRQQEMAVRAALGAGRLRLGRYLLTESLLLGAAGGVLGGLVAIWGVHALVWLVPGNLPRGDEVHLNAGMFGFSVLLAVLTAVLFGLAPAWRGSRADLARTLHDRTHPASRLPLSHVLVVLEMSVALMLLVEAGLFGQSYFRLSKPIRGFDSHDVLTFDVSWPYSPPETMRAFQELQMRLLATPGVRAASVGLQLPDRGRPLLSNVMPFVEVEGRPTAPSERQRTTLVTIQPGYFRTLGITLVAGRDFSDRDGVGAPPVAIVNESLARAYLPNETAISRRLLVDSWTFFGQRTLQIVGVARDVKHEGSRSEAQPLVYVPLTQYPYASKVVVKTDGDALRFAKTVRSVVRSVDKDQPVYDLQTLDQRIRRSVAQDRFNSFLLTTFAILAVTLAISGLYGVLSNVVAQRTHEIGIRMALGAGTADVMLLILRQDLAWALTGLAIGIAGALAVSRVIKSLLFGLSAVDPATIVITALLFAAVAMLAACVPARRATNVDPMVALHCD